MLFIEDPPEFGNFINKNCEKKQGKFVILSKFPLKNKVMSDFINKNRGNEANLT